MLTAPHSGLIWGSDFPFPWTQLEKITNRAEVYFFTVHEDTWFGSTGYHQAQPFVRKYSYEGGSEIAP